MVLCRRAAVLYISTAGSIQISQSGRNRRRALRKVLMKQGDPSPVAESSARRTSAAFAAAPCGLGIAFGSLHRPVYRDGSYHHTFLSGFLIMSGLRYAIAFSAPSSADITGSSCSKDKT